jgi:hypothetical protein
MSLASYCDSLTEEFRKKQSSSKITFKCHLDEQHDEIVINSLDNATQLECIRLKLHLGTDRNVELSFLSRCMIPGDEVLQNVIRFAKKENFHKCTLQDSSTLFFNFGSSGTMVDISLKYLNMLSQGETWYRKKGFKNNSLEEKHFFESLKKEIKKPLMEIAVEIFPHVSIEQAKGFQLMCAEVVSNKDMTEDMRYEFDESIQSYFQRMKTFLQTICPKKETCDMKYLEPFKQLNKYVNTVIVITTIHIFFQNGITIDKTLTFRRLYNSLKSLCTSHVFSVFYELPLDTITFTPAATKRKRNSGSSSSSSSSTKSQRKKN